MNTSNLWWQKYIEGKVNKEFFAISPKFIKKDVYYVVKNSINSKNGSTYFRNISKICFDENEVKNLKDELKDNILIIFINNNTCFKFGITIKNNNTRIFLSEYQPARPKRYDNLSLLDMNNLDKNIIKTTVFSILKQIGQLNNCIGYGLIKDDEFKNEIEKNSLNLEKQSQLNKDSLSIENKDPNEQLKKDIAATTAENMSKDPIKVASGMKESYMLKRIKEFFENQKHLREDFNLHLKDIISKNSIERWKDVDAVDVITAAKGGSKSAIEYIFYKMESVIAKTMWKNFLGPNKDVAYKRLNSGSKEEWVSIAWQVLTGGFAASLKANGEERHAQSMLDYYDVNKTNSSNIWADFARIYGQKLALAAGDFNTSESRTGISSSRDIEVNDISKYANDESSLEDHDYGSTEDIAINNIMDEEFLGKWKQFVQDEELNHKKNKDSPSMANVLFEVLDNPEETNMKNLADSIGLARGTFKAYLENALNIMTSIYDIDPSELFGQLKNYGATKIKSYLDRVA